MYIVLAGKKGSNAVTRIIKTTKLYRIRKNCDAVVNYGLVGRKLDIFLSRNKIPKHTPVINRYIGCTKYRAVKEAQREGILVPNSLISLKKSHKKQNFLIKKMHSKGGIGIIRANSKYALKNKYYQEFIQERRYELRIHAFSWIKKSNWLVQKKFGKTEEITWNYNNGGKFQTVHCPEKYTIFEKAMDIAEKILVIRNMQFGAVDFIITHNNNIIFLEINSAPGFTKLSESTYTSVFGLLTKLSGSKLLQIINK